MMNNPNSPEQQAAMQAAADEQVAQQAAQDAVVDEQAAQVNEVEAADAQAAADEQVINEVAAGLADEEITATDIMTAVLSESLGISPAGAQSLFNLLMSELVDDTLEETEEVNTDTME